MAPRYGLQLYTLRDDCARDLEGTLAFVARCGYAGVEVASTHDLGARQFRALLDAHGLAVASMHAMAFGDEAPRAFEMARELGAQLVVVPFAHPNRFASAREVAELASELNAASEAARKHGLRLGYHNHFWEWRALEDGRKAYDALVAQLDPRVELELDVYWATTAKRDPAALIRELGPRVTRVHLKDGPADKFESPMVALGDGVVDLTSAMQAATRADWMLVELDQCAGEMTEAVRRSAEWLRLPRAAEGASARSPSATSTET
ncbi:MAG: sugar phosphate isomerase/epimerase [Deltaproteobacteria bacterium]|nr:sugar phosphate isomerase/epimerase [Deltaproteobacteria bacterium]